MNSVYIMESDSGLVKIGISKNPLKRANTLENSSGNNIKLRHTLDLDNAKAVEKAAHYILRAKRKNGEWFNVSTREAVRAISDAVKLLSAGQDEKAHEGDKICTMTIRVSPEQKDKLRRWAVAEGVTISEILRRLIERAPERASDGQHKSKAKAPVSSEAAIRAVRRGVGTALKKFEGEPGK